MRDAYQPAYSHLLSELLCSVIFFWLIFSISLSAPVCHGGPLKQVVSTGPSWKTFTNQDGTGLYHDIIRAIFKPIGIEVIHNYTNAVRGIYLVQNDQADFYICKADISDFPDLTLARYPLYEGRFYAIFKKKRFKNWQGLSSMENHRVVWRTGYYKPSEFDIKINIFEADTGTLALRQMILDRVDFYIDDKNLIHESISSIDIPFDMNDCRIEPVGKRTYHPVFKLSERGKQIMKIYNRGIERLHRSGALKKIFNQWGQPYPDYYIPM